jgi:hypothetical protein
MTEYARRYIECINTIHKIESDTYDGLYEYGDADAYTDAEYDKMDDIINYRGEQS